MLEPCGERAVLLRTPATPDEVLTAVRRLTQAAQPPSPARGGSGRLTASFSRLGAASLERLVQAA
jgi:hypothetical protein